MAKLHHPSLTASLQSLRLSSQSTVSTARPSTRLFTTTISRSTKTIRAAWIPKQLVPPYPYGDRQVYKQSNKGLYAQARIRFGNNVASHKLNPIRTPRTWKVNVQYKRLWSNSLRVWIRTRVSTRVLRTIKKCGGLDEYLLGSKTQRIKDLGPTGWRLRWLVLQSERMAKRLNAERERLGLEPEPMLVDGKDPKVERAELRKIACDYATPGPLSKATRDLIEKRQKAAATVAEVSHMSEAFTLGQTAEDDERREKGELYEYESMPSDEPEALEVKAIEMEAQQQPNERDENFVAGISIKEAGHKAKAVVVEAQVPDNAPSMHTAIQADGGPPNAGNESVEAEGAENGSTEEKKS